MNKVLAIFLLLLVSSCASLPEYEKKTYVKIGNTDPYSLKQTIDLNNIFKMDNFDAEEDKAKLLRVNVGGVDTFVTRQPYLDEDIFLEKVSSNDEDFLGLAEACSQKAAFEKVDRKLFLSPYKPLLNQVFKVNGKRSWSFLGNCFTCPY